MRTKNPQIKEGSGAKQRIIDTALDLFYRQGYLATGINQVIAESNVAKNTFYYYFPSKEDLCVAYLQARHKIWGGWFQEKVSSYTTPRARVLGTFDFLEEWMKKCKFRGCAFLNIASEITDSDNRIREEVIKAKDDFKFALKQLVKDLKGSNTKYASLDVPVISSTLYVLLEGAIVASQNYDSTEPIKQARRGFEKMLGTGN